MNHSLLPLHILIVDDDSNIRKTLALSLKTFSCSSQIAESVSDAIEKLKKESFDLVISDYRMGDQTGSHLIQHLKGMNHPPLIAIMTAFASIDNAIEVTKEGAFDYLPKPFSQAQLEHLLNKVRMLVELQRENDELKRSRIRGEIFSGMTSVASQRLESFVKKVAPSDSTLLLSGESGTGKSELARYLHLHSHRAKKPFVVVNCTSLAESLIESEIFGHVKGAFTGAIQDKPGKFELANQGTLFLDEIGDLSLDTQARLLRFLQERVIERVGSNHTIHIDTRIIAATNKNIEEAVKDGRFREDLYYRLNVFECTLVPLRHRQEDIPVFIKQFTEEFSQKASPKTYSSEAREKLCSYAWPGNIRELKNLIERIVLLAPAAEIQASDLPEKLLKTKSLSQATPLYSLEEAEKRHILAVLEAEPNLDKAAEILGITKVTLWRRRKEYGLP